MTARHSTYKKQSRWEKASEIDKTRSSYQRKINQLKRKINKMTIQLKAQKYILHKHGFAFAKLVNEGIIAKGYLKDYLPRKRDVIEMFKGDGKMMTNEEIEKVIDETKKHIYQDLNNMKILKYISLNNLIDVQKIIGSNFNKLKQKLGLSK